MTLALVRYNEQDISVTLSSAEIISAATVGALRFAESVSSGRRDSHGFDKSKSGLSLHIEGACGEVAFAKCRGLYWGATVNSFKAADLERNIQVRTRSSHDYDLIVRSDDADTDVFVLVTGVCPNYLVRGWMYGKDAKKDEFSKDYGGRPSAYFVPASKLKKSYRTKTDANI
jgi:hypothetical protein